MSEAYSIHALTGLRGFACLGVVAMHLLGSGGTKIYLNQEWFELTTIGDIGVIFFFVLSSFLLTVRALTEPQKPQDAKYFPWSRNGIQVPYISKRWVSYIIRRTFRIFPTYIVVMILAAAIPPLQKVYCDLRTYQPFDWLQLLKYVFFIDVNSIFWTIPPEFEWYLIQPFFIVLYEMAERKDKLGEWMQSTKENPPGYPMMVGPLEEKMRQDYRKGTHNHILHFHYRFGRRFLLLLVLTLLNMLVFPLVWSARGAYNYYHVFPFIPRFWLGSLAAFIYHMCAQYGFFVPADPTTSKTIPLQAAKWIARIGDIFCWGMLLAMFLTFPHYGRYLLKMAYPDDEAKQVEQYSNAMGIWPAVGSALVIFVLSFACRGGSFSRFFCWSALTFAGEISFPMYMVHLISIYLVQTLKINGVDGIIFCFLSAYGLATVGHFVVEKPAAAVGSKIARAVKEKWFSKAPKRMVEVVVPEKEGVLEDVDDDEEVFLGRLSTPTKTLADHGRQMGRVEEEAREGGRG
ncbi:hypothetical protein HDV00_005684 [Rhizophlyctis rosea]|nr:hypothetical protein HDV00_005684 [Rhizophlyctis rosea]